MMCAVCMFDGRRLEDLCDAKHKYIDELRSLLHEALPELRGELWQESRICCVCYQYDGHRADCLVTRIERALA